MAITKKRKPYQYVMYIIIALYTVVFFVAFFLRDHYAEYAETVHFLSILLLFVIGIIIYVYLSLIALNRNDKINVLYQEIEDLENELKMLSELNEESEMVVQEMGARLSGTTSKNELFEKSLSVLGSTIGLFQGIGYMCTSDTESIKVMATYGVTLAEVEKNFPSKEGMLEDVLKSNIMLYNKNAEASKLKLKSGLGDSENFDYFIVPIETTKGHALFELAISTGENTTKVLEEFSLLFSHEMSECK